MEHGGLVTDSGVELGWFFNLKMETGMRKRSLYGVNWELACASAASTL